MADFAAKPYERAAQKYLAYAVTKLVHGSAVADQARNVTSTLFGDTQFHDLLSEDIDMLAAEIPTTTAGNIIDALVMSGVAGSNGEARRLIDSGAVSINDEKVSSYDAAVVPPCLIKKGKNSFILAR